MHSGGPRKHSRSELIVYWLVQPDGNSLALEKSIAVRHQRTVWDLLQAAFDHSLQSSVQRKFLLIRKTKISNGFQRISTASINKQIFLLGLCFCFLIILAFFLPCALFSISCLFLPSLPSLVLHLAHTALVCTPLRYSVCKENKLPASSGTST
jgi:hypothetical protein